MRTPQSSRETKYALYLFGAFRLEENVGRKTNLVRFQRRKVEMLLAYLVLHPEAAGHAREKLASLFWGDLPDVQARTSLRTSLAALRKILGDNALLTDRERVQLNPDFVLWVDVREFLRTRAADPASAVEWYRGDLLADNYDDWVLNEREHLRNAYIETLLRLTQQMRSQSEYERAIAFARKILATDSAHETAHQHIMFCELARGNRPAALAQYQECERALRDELGVPPARETQALHHWLKQTSVPVPSSAARITNLPIPLTSFIGRKHELTQGKILFNGSRLLTFIGAGGTGKTRLSVQLATELLDAFHDGVWWVELANVTAPALVPQMIRQALGISETPHQSIQETLSHFLRDRTLLLVLDNCEHLIAACAEIAEALLQACPNLKILATSREPLQVMGETVWQVPTLAVPPDKLAREHLLLAFEGVRLFVERARAVQPGFELTEQNANAVVEICRRLDGIPLAIELAAARVAVLAVEEIAARLSDRFGLLTQGSRTALPRQQTLRALIDWSFDLLAEDERVLFRRLAIFAGSFTLDAAQAICSDTLLTQDRVFDGLARLIAKSLLLKSAEPGSSRYYFLETIREYAREKLDQAGELEILHVRHWDWFFQTAEIAEIKLRGAEQLVWLARLEADHADLRAALEWARAAQRPAEQGALRMAAHLARFWFLRGYWHEGRTWLEPAWRDKTISLTHAKALMGLAELVFRQAGYVASSPIYQTSLSRYQQLGDQWGIALVSALWGDREPDLAHAQQLFDASLAHAQDLNNDWLWATILLGAGIHQVRLGNVEQGIKIEEQALEHARRCGDGFLISNALNNLGERKREKRDYVSAIAYYEESLEISHTIGNISGITITSINLGQVAVRLQDYARAQALFRESLQRCRELDNRAGFYIGMLGQARLMANTGHIGRAVALFAALQADIVAMHFRLDPADRTDFNDGVESARAQLDAPTFEALWREGEKMEFQQALDWVIQNF